MVSDIVVAIWIAVWVLVGVAVHSAISTDRRLRADVESGANGVAGNLGGARRGRTRCRCSETRSADPLGAAGGFARDIAGAGAQLDTTADVAGVAAGAGGGRPADPGGRDAVAVAAAAVLPAEVGRR